MHQDLIETFERLGVRDVEVTDDVDKALARITAIYEGAVERLRVGPAAASTRTARRPGRPMPSTRSSASRLEASALNLDGRLAYGALHDPGVYGATLTHPRLFQDYYRTQLALLVRNHGGPAGDRHQRPADPAAVRGRGDRQRPAARRSCTSCNTCSRCRTSATPTTTSPTAPGAPAAASRRRWRCSPPSASTTACSGSTTTPARTPSTSSASCC